MHYELSENKIFTLFQSTPHKTINYVNFMVEKPGRRWLYHIEWKSPVMRQGKKAHHLIGRNEHHVCDIPSIVYNLYTDHERTDNPKLKNIL